MFNILLFGSTSDFAFNAFCIQYILVSFNAIASVQPFLFKFQEHILRSTLFISFNAIYFRSTIYCTAVETVFQTPVTSRDQEGLGNSGQPLCNKSLNESQSR